MSFMRLDKLVSSSGAASRKDVKAMIKSGRVTVSGVVAKDPGMKVDPDTDRICLDGDALAYEEHRYILMNKPAGVVSSTDDPRDSTVLDLLPEEYRKYGLFPAGRLDKDAEGLLILTDDGDYCHSVISPKKNVFKKYYIKTQGELTPKDAEAVAAGIKTLGGGDFLPGKLDIIGKNEAFIYIREGKYHQVKRMMASLEKPVSYLKRVSIGMLKIDEDLPKGGFRKIPKEEAMLVFENDDEINCLI